MGGPIRVRMGVRSIEHRVVVLDLETKGVCIPCRYQKIGYLALLRWRYLPQNPYHRPLAVTAICSRHILEVAK
ncbi:hypothetical protein Pr1d_03510 [Bythopirellula goksoeyrii]|uniref:Uncharacterized protein n=1 Tax=Bythopirellula goksoeyrii TaxID=1400387 RepID=A0A5B9Q5S4_9BACT|nr:hypothetical protein Pr1d_03510 [Bythopirellula goksoeyrii]